VTPASHDHLDRICHSIGQKLRDLAAQRGNDSLSEIEFINEVLRIEAVEIAPHGLTLTASNTLDDWTVFKIKVNGTGETCAEFEFLPETGEFRDVGFHCSL
jgi:hypothetical protein